MFTPDDLLQQAQRLKDALDARDLRPRAGRYGLSACQELLARTLGAAHWHEAHKNAQGAPARRGLAVPPRSSPASRPPSMAPVARAFWSRWPTDHLLGHALLLGASGSGRTSALKTLALTGRETNRGMVWLTTDPLVLPFLTEMNAGRMESVQHLDFQRVGNGAGRRFNPGAWMDSADLIAWLTALGQGRLPGPPDGWSQAGWHDRAMRVWEAVVPALVWRRRAHGITLDLDTLLNAITWDGIRALWEQVDLPEAPRQALRRYITPWFTSSEASAFMAPVGPAWAKALGTLRRIGPYLDGASHPFDGETGGNLYQMIEQRETLVVSMPAAWTSPADPRAHAYDAFLIALAQVLRTRGPGLRAIDPAKPLPWRLTLVLDDVPGLERFGPDLPAAATARGVALVASYPNLGVARRCGLAPAWLNACRTTLQLRPDSVNDPVGVPASLDVTAWSRTLMAQRPGEAWCQSPSTTGWIRLDHVDRSLTGPC